MNKSVCVLGNVPWQYSSCSCLMEFWNQMLGCCTQRFSLHFGCHLSLIGLPLGCKKIRGAKNGRAALLLCRHLTPPWSLGASGHPVPRRAIHFVIFRMHHMLLRWSKFSSSQPLFFWGGSEFSLSLFFSPHFSRLSFSDRIYCYFFLSAKGPKACLFPVKFPSFPSLHLPPVLWLRLSNDPPPSHQLPFPSCFLCVVGKKN